MFEAEAANLAAVFGEQVVAIEHVGSTAVPGLVAKAIIDIMVIVADLPTVDASDRPMAELGYEPRGEFGIAGRRYYPKDIAGRRTYQVHLYETGNPEIERHLLFRDYLRTHPEAAAAYGRHKEDLAGQFP
jgi:GrpB-like predicted nucleotidyltransferase (UPF0157 family)